MGMLRKVDPEWRPLKPPLSPLPDLPELGQEGAICLGMLGAMILIFIRGRGQKP